MPLPLAFLVGLLVGMTLPWIARNELARSEVPLVLARPFLVSVALASLVFLPIVGYFVALHGDWSYLYLVRNSRIPSALDLVLVVLSAVAVPVGFAISTPWAIAKRGSMLLKVAAGIGFVLVVLGVICMRRLGVSASFAQYHGGFGAVAIGKSPLGRGVLLSWLALLGAYAWSFLLLRDPRGNGG